MAPYQMCSAVQHSGIVLSGKYWKKRSPVFALLTPRGLGIRGHPLPPLHQGSRAESAWRRGCEHTVHRGSRPHGGWGVNTRCAEVAERMAPGVWTLHGARGVNTRRTKVAGGSLPAPGTIFALSYAQKRRKSSFALSAPQSWPVDR